MNTMTRVTLLSLALALLALAISTDVTASAPGGAPGAKPRPVATGAHAATRIPFRPPADLVPSISMFAGMPVADGASVKVPVGMQMVAVQVRVRNMGGSAAPAGSTTLIRVLRNGVQVLSQNRTEPALAPGGVSVRAYPVPLAAGGKFEVYVTADVAGVVNEANEGNNTASHTATVQHASVW